jgi:superfamily I DNA and/or RNA helicase
MIEEGQQRGNNSKIKDKWTSTNDLNKNDHIFLQEIWEKFTDVQEQMIRLRSAPISIIPDSAKIVSEKLFLKVNENDVTNSIIDEIASTFELASSEINIEDGYFFADIKKSQCLKQDILNQLAERASANFIKFRPLPIIDGFVIKKESPIKKIHELLGKAGFEYSFDKKGRLQISITNLRNFGQITTEGKLNIHIPDTASIILPLRPNPVYFLKNEFPEIDIKHKTHGYRKKEIVCGVDDRTLSWTRKIEISNGFINESVIEQLKKDIGLNLIGYDMTFFINPEAISKYDPKISPYILPRIDSSENSFTFHTNLKDTADNNEENLLSSYNDEKWDFDLKYTRLKKFFNFYFGSENVSCKIKSIYNYDILQFENEYLPKKDFVKSDFWESIRNSFSDGEIAISENTDTIGIDFNWKNDRIEDVICDQINKCDIINFGFFGNHRCNIDFQVQDITLDEAEDLLREKFPSIDISRDDKNGILYFYQEYLDSEQGSRLKQIIDSELKSLDSSNIHYGLYPCSTHKEKFILKIDKATKRESLESALKALRGTDFYAFSNFFGKLLRVNFPEIIFDISGSEVENTKQLFESKIISVIEPNLTGDLEKVFRLKNSLSNILKGTNLQNPNLKDFIFDAGKAKKIEAIETYTNPQSETFKELDFHLLNKRINDSQKQAIIKTLLAEDLALIQGPPGTGKSTAIAEIIWQHIRRNPKERILLTSETNLAVDNAIDRIVNNSHNLVKPIRFGDEEKMEMEGRQFSIDVMKRWVQVGKVEIDSVEQSEEEESTSQKLILLNWIENIKERALNGSDIDNKILTLWLETLSKPTKDIRQIFYDNYIRNCNLIGATCSSIGERNTKNNPTSFFKSYCEIFGKIKNKSNRDGENYTDYNGKLVFTTIIQDESSKATPAELSLPLMYGKKNIVIGDHRQLPPMLDKEEFKISLDFLLDKADNKAEIIKLQKLKSFVLNNFSIMEVSHFERLYENIDNSIKGIFNLQYRMHPDINEVIKQFYLKDGGLECGLISPIDLGVNDMNLKNPASRYHGIEIDGLISKNNHVIWIDINTPELLDGTSRINFGEIDAIRGLLSEFQNSDSFNKYQSNWTNPEDQQIGLISFYGKQIKLLKSVRSEFRDLPIRVSTVDRFQGMERNIIIVSMVRSNRFAYDKNQKADFDMYGELGYQEQKDFGFAQSPNRLNVALSRAKRLLIIVGSSELFRQKEIYDNVYQTIVNNPNGRIIKYKIK